VWLVNVRYAPIATKFHNEMSRYAVSDRRAVIWLNFVIGMGRQRDSAG